MWSERLTAISRDISPHERERASERIKADHSLSLGAAALWHQRGRGWERAVGNGRRWRVGGRVIDEVGGVIKWAAEWCGRLRLNGTAAPERKVGTETTKSRRVFLVVAPPSWFDFLIGAGRDKTVAQQVNSGGGFFFKSTVFCEWSRLKKKLHCLYRNVTSMRCFTIVLDSEDPELSLSWLLPMPIVTSQRVNF